MEKIKRAFQSVVFNSGQKMALRAFYFIRALLKALKYYYINRSQRHLLAAIENNCFRVPKEENDLWKLDCTESGWQWIELLQELKVERREEWLVAMFVDPSFCL